MSARGPSAAGATVIDLTRMKMALAMAQTVRAMLDASEVLGNATEALLAQLDQLKGDADHEPSLGAPEAMAGPVVQFNQSDWAAGGDTDEREESDGDQEPSLGAACPQAWTDQTRWADGPRHDFEEQCEDEGAQCDDEGHVEGW
jgi:hypothetical protein